MTKNYTSSVPANKSLSNQKKIRDAEKFTADILIKRFEYLMRSYRGLPFGNKTVNEIEKKIHKILRPWRGAYKK